MFKQLYTLYGFDIFKILKDIHKNLNISLKSAFLLATIITDNIKTLSIENIKEIYSVDENEIKKSLKELLENKLIEIKLEQTIENKNKETIYTDNTFLKIEEYFLNLKQAKEKTNEKLKIIIQTLKQKAMYKISFEEINQLKLWIKEEKYTQDNILEEINYLILNDVFSFKKLKILLEKYDTKTKDDSKLTEKEINILKGLK